MAFNINAYSRISGSANNDIVTLQNGTASGAPSFYSYVSFQDTVATIVGVDYFAQLAAVLNIGDFIYAVGSDTTAFLTVTALTVQPPSVTVAQGVVTGDVLGPASAVDNNLAAFDGTTGKIIKDSGQSIATIQNGSLVYAASSAGTDTYAVTLSPVPTAYVNGFTVNFKADVANTGAATLNVNGLGPISITKFNGSALSTGDIGANHIATVVYNSTGPTFQLQSQGISDVVGPASSTDNALARFDGTTGKVIQNSVAILDDLGALSGLTQLNVDNVQINGNTFSSTDTDGNLNFTPDGAGINVLANAQVTNLTASKVVVTDASKNLASSSVDAATLPYAVLQNGSPIYGASSAGTDDYVLTLSPVPAAYVEGMVINFKADVANTGAATLDVNSLGAVAIQKNGAAIVTGDITANQITTVIYNSTGPVWQMQSQPGSSSGIVNSGTINELAWYAATGNTVSGLATANYGFAQTSSTGVPSIAQTYSNIRTINQTTHGLSAGNVVKLSGASTYATAQANSAANAEVVGIVAAVIDVDNFVLQFGGHVTGLSGLTAATMMYLDPAVAGGLTATKPTTATQVVKPVLLADTTTTGYWTNQLGVVL